MYNSSLKRKVGLKTHTRLKSNKGLQRRKGINPKSDKQRAKDKLWNKITNEKCYEIDFICLWCKQPGQRNDNTRFDYLDGHHIQKRRYNNHTKSNCYPVHRAPCHNEVDVIDITEYPDKEAWERRKQ